LVATKGKGLIELKQTIIEMLKNPKKPLWKMNWPLSIQRALDPLIERLTPTHPDLASCLALRLLEGDQAAAQEVDESIRHLANQEIAAIESDEGEEPDTLIADARYGAISDLVSEISTQVASRRRSVSAHIDKIVLNRVLGIPIFFAMMYLMFLFSINVGGAFQDFFDISSDAIFVQSFAKLMISWHWPDWAVALLANGFGRGINTTITFIPVIGALFLFLSFLEDSGYMARAAFVMDRLMQAVGLPGKAFVPMIVGFGCNVPAVMAARTLSNRRDRILTVMMMPFMSCGARLAIFAVFASAFFQQGGQNIIFALYVTGILVAVLTGFLLRKTLLKGEPAAFVMELPPYHWPSLNSVFRHAWHRLKSFIVRAGQYIVPICMLIGLLNAINIHGKLLEGDQESLLAKTGQVITPIFKPMGISSENWPATVGLVTGVLAKEVVVGTLNSLYSQAGHLGEKVEHEFKLSESLKEAFTSIWLNLSSLKEALNNPFVASEAPHEMNNQVYGYMVKQFGGGAAAFAYLLFVLLYFPCVSTVAAMRREIGHSWALFSMFWSTGLAYTLSILCYQLMTFRAHSEISIFWISGILFFWLITILALRGFAEPNKGTANAS
jgi:ferrous iron transport protein B